MLGTLKEQLAELEAANASLKSNFEAGMTDAEQAEIDSLKAQLATESASLQRLQVREHSPAVERCGPHVAISPTMLRSSLLTLLQEEQARAQAEAKQAEAQRKKLSRALAAANEGQAVAEADAAEGEQVIEAINAKQTEVVAALHKKLAAFDAEKGRLLLAKQAAEEKAAVAELQAEEASARAEGIAEGSESEIELLKQALAAAQQALQQEKDGAQHTEEQFGKALAAAEAANLETAEIANLKHENAQHLQAALLQMETRVTQLTDAQSNSEVLAKVAQAQLVGQEMLKKDHEALQKKLAASLSSSAKASLALKELQQQHKDALSSSAEAGAAAGLQSETDAKAELNAGKKKYQRLDAKVCAVPVCSLRCLLVVLTNYYFLPY